jgi:uncharacterized membrane protein
MNPVVPLPLAIVALALAVAAQVWYWRRSRLRGRARLLAFVLRLGAIALLGWILCGPESPILSRSEARPAVVLVDVSRSMEFPGDGGTRTQQARTVIDRLQQAGVASAHSEVHGFGSRLLATGETGDDQSVRDASLPAGALRTVLSSALASRPPQSVLLISDGAAQDASELPVIAKAFRDRGIPVSVLCTGSTVPLKNAALTGLDAPRQSDPGARVPVTVTARREGLDAPLMVELLGDADTIIDRATLPAGTGEASATLNLTLPPAGFEGRVRLSAIEGESTLTDNEAPLRIASGKSKLRVLYMEGSTQNSVGVPEPLILCRALTEHDDIEVDLLCLNEQNTSGGAVLVHWPWQSGSNFRPDPSRSYPETREELNRYDVIICSDIPRVSFSDEQIQWTADLVAERGAGFVMIGGNTSFGAGLWDRTPWEKLVPLDMDESSRGFMYQNFSVHWPQAGKQHPLLALMPLEPGESLDQLLEAHPQLLGTNFIHRAKPAATVLMRMEDESGVPIIAVQPFGKGRTMAFTSDVTFMWGTEHNRNWGPPDGVSDPSSTRMRRRTNFVQREEPLPEGASLGFNNSYYRRFWQRAVRWLGENSVRVQASGFQVTTPSLEWTAGQPLPLAAASSDEGLMSRLARMPCLAQVRGRPATRTRLEWDEASRRFLGSLPRPNDLPEEVEIDVEVRDPLVRSTLQASLSVRAPRTDPEVTQASANPQLLASLAATSGGNVLHTADDAVAWLNQSRQQADSPAATGRKPAWDHGWVLATVLGLLSAEWLLRRFFS